MGEKRRAIRKAIRQAIPRAFPRAVITARPRTAQTRRSDGPRGRAFTGQTAYTPSVTCTRVASMRARTGSSTFKCRHLMAPRRSSDSVLWETRFHLSLLSIWFALQRRWEGPQGRHTVEMSCGRSDFRIACLGRGPYVPAHITGPGRPGRSRNADADESAEGARGLEQDPCLPSSRRMGREQPSPGRRDAHLPAAGCIGRRRTLTCDLGRGGRGGDRLG